MIRPLEEEDVKFDADVHLQIEDPGQIMDLNFTKRDFPIEGDYETAYADPIRFLSIEGLHVMKSIIEVHRHKAI